MVTGVTGTLFLSEFNTISLTALTWSLLACLIKVFLLFLLAAEVMAFKNGFCLWIISILIAYSTEGSTHGGCTTVFICGRYCIGVSDSGNLSSSTLFNIILLQSLKFSYQFLPSLISPVPTNVITDITVIISIIVSAATARRCLPDPGGVKEGGLLFLPRPCLRPCPLRLLELDELLGI